MSVPRTTRRRRRAIAASALLAGLAGCELFGGGPPGDGGARYVACDDAEARSAWHQAQQALASGDDLAALPLLRAAIGGCPELVPAHRRYQDVARRLGGDDEQTMVAYYAELPDVEGSPVPAYLRARLAETAYAQSNALDRILEQHPNFGWALLSRGRVQRSQGRLSEALRDFGRAVVVAPDLHEARLAQARALVELGRDEEAANAFDAYLRARPGDQVAGREYVTLLLYRLGRIGPALQRIDALEAHGDRSVALRMDRAAALWRAGLLQASVELYVEILREAPTTARAALNIGLIYYEIVPHDDDARRRCWPKARAAFRMFLQRVEPHDGLEQFECTWAVPFRLQRIAALLGPADTREPSVDQLVWPDDWPADGD